MATAGEPPLFKYPRTRHLADSALQAGDDGGDRTPFVAIAGCPVVYEEKVDNSRREDVMAASTKIRRDEHGLYVRAGGYVFRPGPINGYSHAYDMSDAGLKEGDEVKASHVAGTPTGRIRLADGRQLRWGDDYLHEREATRGSRDMPLRPDAVPGQVTPLHAARDGLGEADLDLPTPPGVR